MVELYSVNQELFKAVEKIESNLIEVYTVTDYVILRLVLVLLLPLEFSNKQEMR